MTLTTSEWVGVYRIARRNAQTYVADKLFSYYPFADLVADDGARDEIYSDVFSATLDVCPELEAADVSDVCSEAVADEILRVSMEGDWS